MGFHRLTVPGYPGGLRGGDDYINNAVSGTPAPASNVLAATTYIGSYFFATGEQVTGAAVNRGLKALAANCDFLDDAIVAQGTAVSAAVAAEAAFRTRERTSALVVTANTTLTINQQLVRLNAAGGFAFVALPNPALSAGRWFIFEMPTTASYYRLVPSIAELINGVAGYTMNQPGAKYLVFTPDGVNWQAGLMPASVRSSSLYVQAVVPSSANSGDVVQCYGGGFLDFVDDILINGFGESVVAGSHVVHDDGWMSVTLGGGGGTGQPFVVTTLVVRDPEDPDYDGATMKAVTVTAPFAFL